MNNISFKGYSNIISAYKIPLGNTMTSYIAAKLDDNGEKDLTKLKEIRKIQGYPDNFPNNDILTMIYIDTPKTDTIYFSEKPMCWGEQLKVVEKNYVPKLLPEAEYRKLENAHLKAYTLIASLTKRMMNDKFENEDENITRVVKTLYNNLLMLRERTVYPIFGNNEAFELTAAGCLKQTKFQPLAEFLNNKVAKTMTNFFK